MQFIDLKKQYEQIRDSVNRRIQTVLDHGHYILGPEVEELESSLASFAGTKHCITCSNGTDALLLPLMAKGIGPGDAIFTTSFTFIATAEVITLLGATPVFVDINPDTFNIDPSSLEDAIKNLSDGKKNAQGIPEGLKPRGIIAVDLFGLPADYDAINAIAGKYSLFVIEDAAQSFGAGYKGRKAGCLAETASTSFFPAKPLGCYGDGGAIFTDNDNMAGILKSLRVHGKGADKYDNIRIGINGRLDTIQAAILLAKMEVFAAEIAKRQVIAGRYNEGLAGRIKTPLIPDGYSSAWSQYSLVTKKRDALLKKLNACNIPSMVYYPRPLHMQTAFAYLGYAPESLPISRRISETILSIPMHPYLDPEDQQCIIDIVCEFCNE